MAYQNNNNRITPKAVGKQVINPVTQMVDKKVRYQPNYAEAQANADMANALASIGKGIIDLDKSGVLQDKAKEKAIELLYEEDIEGKNRHDWIEAQKKVKGLAKFNPYLKDAYNDLVAQDYFQKATFDLTSDPSYYTKSKEEITAFINERKEDFTKALKESGISPKIGASYLEGFHNNCNKFYNQYLQKNAEFTYETSLGKISTEGEKALRTSFYNVPKEQQGSVINTVVNNIVKTHPDIATDDLVNKVLVPMAGRVIKSHTGAIEQADFINAVKNIKIGNTALTDIDPDIELKLRDTFKTVALQAMQEEEALYRAEEKKLTRATKEAEKEFFQTLFSNPDIDLVDTAQQLAIKYGIESNYGALLSTVVSNKDKLNKLQDVESNPDVLKIFDTQLGLEQLDRNELTQAYTSGLISRSDYFSILDRDVKREEKATKASEAAIAAGYKATFDEVKAFANNLDTKKLLRDIKTGEGGKSTAYADYLQLVASINTAVANDEITKIEGQKRLKELQDYYTKVYLSKKEKAEFEPKNLLSKDWRARNLNKLKEAKYNEKAATNAFKQLGMLSNPFLKITSGIKDDRTVTLKDGTTKTSSHQAYDIRAKEGTVVRMPASSGGQILFKGSNDTMGNFILVQLDASGDYMILQHLQYVPNWKVGQKIPKGYKLAQTGATGAVEAEHLDISFYKADGSRRLSVEDFTNRLNNKK